MAPSSKSVARYGVELDTLCVGLLHAKSRQILPHTSVGLNLGRDHLPWIQDCGVPELQAHHLGTRDVHQPLQLHPCLTRTGDLRSNWAAANSAGPSQCRATRVETMHWCSVGDGVPPTQGSNLGTSSLALVVETRGLEDWVLNLLASNHTKVLRTDGLKGPLLCWHVTCDTDCGTSTAIFSAHEGRLDSRALRAFHNQRPRKMHGKHWLPPSHHRHCHMTVRGTFLCSPEARDRCQQSSVGIASGPFQSSQDSVQVYGGEKVLDVTLHSLEHHAIDSSPLGKNQGTVHQIVSVSFSATLDCIDVNSDCNFELPRNHGILHV